NHEWLAQIFLAFLYQLGGLPLIAVFNALVISLLIYQWVSRLLRAKLSVFMSLGVGFLVFLTTAQVWSPRPHLFSLLFFSTTLLILQKFRFNQKERLWCLPVIFLFWVNLPSGFAAGLALLFLLILSEGITIIYGLPGRLPSLRYKHLTLIGVICLLMSF